MELKPIKQTNIYGLDNFFNELINLYKNNELPNKILLSGTKGIGKSTLAYHLINYVLSLNEEYSYDSTNYSINPKNKSYILVNNNTHPNFFLIDILKEKKSIDIDQVRNLIDYTNKSSFNNSPRFILIDNINFLNINSINALLKVLEEPGDNIYFILINNNKKILSTLRSRCLNFKIDISSKDSLDISNKILNLNISNLINKEFINYYNTPGDYCDLFDYSNKYEINLSNLTLNNFLRDLIDNNRYKKDSALKDLIYKYIEVFFVLQANKSHSKDKILFLYNMFINKINDFKKFNLDEESLFLEFKSKVLNE